MYILVTGGAGFIGSNFLLYFFEKNPDAKIINLDFLKNILIIFILMV